MGKNDTCPFSLFCFKCSAAVLRHVIAEMPQVHVEVNVISVSVSETAEYLVVSILWYDSYLPADAVIT